MPRGRRAPSRRRAPPSPNAASASPRAVAYAASSSSGAVDEPHALAAAARGRLQQHRVAELLGRARATSASDAPPSVPGTSGTPAARISAFARALSPIRSITSARGPDEDEVVVRARARRTRGSRRGSRSRDGPPRSPSSPPRRSPPGCAGSSAPAAGGPMQTARSARRTCSESAVGRRVDGDGLDAELVERADHAHGDLAAVRDEDAGEHQSASRAAGGAAIGSSSNSSWPNSTGWAFSTWIATTRPVALRLHLVHELHRLEDAERLPGARRRRRPRRTAASPARRRGRTCRPSATRRGRRPAGRRRRAGSSSGSSSASGAAPTWTGTLLGAAHRDAHAVVLDLDLGDAALLDDPHDLADPLGARLLDAARERVLARVAAADRAQQRLRLLAEQREQDELLLARREAFRLLRARPRPSAGRRPAARRRSSERDGACDGRVDRARRRAVAALDERPELVDDGAVAPRGEDVDERLRREDLADRRGERRPAGLVADPLRPRRAPRAAGRPRRARADAASSAATSPAGRSCSAARTAIRGASGVTGSSPMCSSTRSHASQSRSTSTPVAKPSPSSDSASASPETRCSVSASG